MSADGSPFGNFKLSLQSAVCHRGTTVDSGHYVGLVRCPEPANSTQDKWMRLDDLAKERVIDVNVEQFLLDESPYLLFYQVQPIEGDPGNIVGGEPSLEIDEPPAYSEHWSSESLVELDEKGPLNLNLEHLAENAAITNGEMCTTAGVRTSQNGDRPRSILFTDSTATTAVAEAMPRLSIDGDGPGSLTASRRPSNSKSGAAPIQDGIAPLLENNRFSASMSRLASRLSKDKPEIVAPAGPFPNGGPSLEVREVARTIDRGKLKKEKSSNKPKDHQHLVKGRSKSDKPDRECLVM